MNEKIYRDFIEIAFNRLLSSAWNYDDAAKELKRLVEIEESVWKKQEYESTSVFDGKFYL